ncbi:MAG: transposase, partial [Akkermansia sp.]
TPDNKQAIKNFDRKRSKKISNKDWVNPHNPDATIGITKDGGWDMLHKPEHLIDLDNGIIVEAEVRKGDEGDSVNLLDRIEKAWKNLGIVCKDKDSTEVVKSITADGGYFSAEQVVGLRSAGCEVNMRDPHGEKRSYNQYTKEDAQHLKNELEEIRQTTNSEWGIKYRKKRSELVERSFAHILDNGGMRRSHLKSLNKINKTYSVAVIAYNLSILMRRKYKLGTKKQWEAARKGQIAYLLDLLKSCVIHLMELEPENTLLWVCYMESLIQEEEKLNLSNLVNR